MSEKHNHYRTIKLNPDTLQAVTELSAKVKMPVSFNALVNYLILVYGIPEFQKKELLLRGQLAQSKKYKTK